MLFRRSVFKYKLNYCKFSCSAIDDAPLLLREHLPKLCTPEIKKLFSSAFSSLILSLKAIVSSNQSLKFELLSRGCAPRPPPDLTREPRHPQPPCQQAPTLRRLMIGFIYELIYRVARHRERREAIQGPRPAALDCFLAALLAMTAASRDPLSHPRHHRSVQAKFRRI